MEVRPGCSENCPLPRPRPVQRRASCRAGSGAAVEAGQLLRRAGSLATVAGAGAAMAGQQEDEFTAWSQYGSRYKVNCLAQNTEPSYAPHTFHTQQN